MFDGTTVIAVRKGPQVAIGGDGQVTFGGNVIMKHTARKIRRLHNGTVLAGFAGSVADAVTLFEKFEEKLEQYHGNLVRAAVELAKDWRTDRTLRRLESMLIVANEESLLVLSGSGEVIEPDDPVAAIGSGGSFALAAARALLKHGDLSAEEIVRESLHIAASLCVYTNDSIQVETIDTPLEAGGTKNG